MKRHLNIVIAEDSSDETIKLKNSLKSRKGWTICVVTDREDIVASVYKNKADAVVMGASVPGRALNVLHKLKSSHRTAHVPVMVVNDSVESQHKELFNAGANDCFQQPLDDRNLGQALLKMVANTTPLIQAPQRIVDDPNRMAALQETAMLDYVPSDQFGQITALAAKMLDVPVALVSLVDKDRQYFLSQHGLNEPWVSRRETPLTHSFCQWVVSGNEPLVVNDARKHKILKTNKAVTEVGVMAYAGLPINAGDSQQIGSFCAIDTKPRSWNYNDLAILHDLAQLTESFMVVEKDLLSSGKTKPLDQTLGENEVLFAIRSAAKGISAVTSLLSRKGLPLSSTERKAMFDIIKMLSKRQYRLVSA